MRPLIYRNATFTGTIDFKQITPPGSGNIFPYVIPNGAVVEVHLPADPNSPNNGAPVVLSSATALPNPPFTANEVVINIARTGVSFTCIPAKAKNMAVGTRLSVDVKVIKDPLTTPTPANVDVFESVKVIDVKDPDNA